MKYILNIVVIIFFIGCGGDSNLDKQITTPEQVQIYDINVDNIMPNIHNGKKLLKNFPFVSYNLIMDFNGKFSYQFYDKIDYRYKYSSLDKVDFWKLRTNPFLYDFIYVLPMWVEDFKRVSNDLFKDIGYTYNLSLKEQDILKWWVSQGGILWIESGVYSTRYDTFKRNGEIDEKAINAKLINKTKNLHFLVRQIHTYVYKTKKIDFVNYKPTEVDFNVVSKYPYFQDIKKLKIKNSNYLTIYMLPKAKYLLEDSKGNPLVSFIQYGKGGVVFLRDFEYFDKRFDGELLRWKLLFYLLNKQYMQNEIEKKFNNNEVVRLNNLHFKYNSYQLTEDSKKLLKPIIRYLKKYPKVKISVIGNTDSIGSAAYNKKLSLQRANSVKKELMFNGISENRISVRGDGESNPIASNKTSTGRAKNRRVDFKIIK